MYIAKIIKFDFWLQFWSSRLINFLPIIVQEEYYPKACSMYNKYYFQIMWSYKELKKKEKIKRKNATKISREKFLGFVFEHAQLSAA